MTASRWYYVHIPKTAGTSLIAALDPLFAPAERCPAQTWAQLAQLAASQRAGYRYYRGHFGALGLDPFGGGGTRLLTVLRDPVALALSRYRWVWREPADPLHERVRGQRLSFAQFIRDRHCQWLIDNPQTRSLAFGFGARQRAELELALASHDPDAALKALADWPANPASQWQRALATIEQRVAWIGLSERLDQDVAVLARGWGVATPPLPRLMVAPASEAPAQPTANDRSLISDLNGNDMRLYEAVRSGRLGPGQPLQPLELRASQ